MIQTLLTAFKGTAGISVDQFYFGVCDNQSGDYLSCLNPFIEDLLVLMRNSSVKTNSIF